jgi:acid phosphatase (class A)
MKVYPILQILALTVCLLAAALVQPASAAPPPLATELTKNARGFIHGYLRNEDLPDGAALVPPPPAAGSPAALADEVTHRAARTQSTPAA